MQNWQAMDCHANKLVGKSLHQKEILSNVSVNVVSTVESSSHQGWSIVQLSSTPLELAMTVRTKMENGTLN